MVEEAEDKIEPQRENIPEKQDNRLPYEPPKLRKHGKINDTTLAILVPAARIDARFGPGRLDLS